MAEGSKHSGAGVAVHCRPNENYPKDTAAYGRLALLLQDEAEDALKLKQLLNGRGGTSTGQIQRAICLTNDIVR